MQWKVMH
jgi:tripartite-type tricarboxylate transporter receptor subunit TctC